MLFATVRLYVIRLANHHVRSAVEYPSFVILFGKRRPQNRYRWNYPFEEIELSYQCWYLQVGEGI